MQHIQVLTIQYVLQILTVLVLLQYLVYSQNILTADPTVEIGNLPVLMLLCGFHIVGGIYKALMRAGIKPSKTLTEQLYVKNSILQINAIKVCNFQFSADRGLQILRKIDHTVIIEIQTCYTVVALRFCGFFFY